jgi:hypothetical protein
MGHYNPQPFLYSARDFGDQIHRVGGVNLLRHPKPDGALDFARWLTRSDL